MTQTTTAVSDTVVSYTVGGFHFSAFALGAFLSGLSGDRFAQRDRVAADYAGWVTAGCDRLIDLLGSRQGIVSVYGDVNERTLKEFARQIRNEIVTLPGVTRAEFFGLRPYEISIEVSEFTLQGYGMTLLLVGVFLLVWYLVVTWNEESNKLIVPM